MNIEIARRARRATVISGFIVTNPNCSTIMVALALAPIGTRVWCQCRNCDDDASAFGAGYPGVASLDILDNVLPHIEGEEEKVENETRKDTRREQGTGSRVRR